MNMDTNIISLQELRDRGMGHVAELLELAAARPWIRNEALEGGDGVGETAVADPIDGVDDGGDVTPEPVAAAPAFTLDDVRGAVGDQFQQMLAQAEAEERAAQARAQSQAAANAELPPWDPFDPQVVLAYNQRAMMEQLGPVLAQAQRAAEIADQYQHQQGAQEANTILDGFKGEIGDFDNARAIEAARQLVARGADPQQALEHAARQERAYVEKIEADALARFRGAGQNLADLSAEPAGGAGAAGEVSTLPRGPKGYSEQLRRTLANSGQRPGVGGATG